jgi:hypothetical protein
MWEAQKHADPTHPVWLIDPDADPGGPKRTIRTAYAIAIRNLYMAAPVYGKERMLKWRITRISMQQLLPEYRIAPLVLGKSAYFASLLGHHYGERSSPSSTRAPRDKHVLDENRTRAACVTGEHSNSKELFKQLMLLLFGTSTVYFTVNYQPSIALKRNACSAIFVELFHRTSGK